MKLAHLNPILAGMEERRAGKRDWHREREGESHTKTNETMKKTEREAAVAAQVQVGVQGCSREEGMTGV